MSPLWTFGPIPPYRGRHTNNGRPHATDYKNWQLDGRRSLGRSYSSIPGHDLGDGLSMSAEMTPEITAKGATRWSISMRIRLASTASPTQAALLTFDTEDPRTTITSDDLATIARDAMRDHLTALLAKLEPTP